MKLFSGTPVYFAIKRNYLSSFKILRNQLSCMGKTIVFLLVSLALVASSIGVVLSKHLFRNAIFLALSLLLTAVLYIFLGAELLAGIQILLYTGGVVTLVVFAILLTERMGGERLYETHRGIVPALLASIALFALLVYFTWASPKLRYLNNMASSVQLGVSKSLSENIFQDWVLPFEVLSVLLLASIIGALVLARREKE